MKPTDTDWRWCRCSTGSYPCVSDREDGSELCEHCGGGHCGMACYTAGCCQTRREEKDRG